MLITCVRSQLSAVNVVFSSSTDSAALCNGLANHNEEESDPFPEGPMQPVSLRRVKSTKGLVSPTHSMVQSVYLVDDVRIAIHHTEWL